MPLRLEWPGSRLYKFIHSAGRSSSPIWYLRSEARVARRGEATRPGREWERERETRLTLFQVPRRPRCPPDRSTFFASRKLPRDRCESISRDATRSSERCATPTRPPPPSSLSVFLRSPDAPLITWTFAPGDMYEPPRTEAFLLLGGGGRGVRWHFCMPNAHASRNRR